MENVSHLFLFKGKLQTKSPLSPQNVVSPSSTTPNAIDVPFRQNWGPLPQTANLLILLLRSVQRQVAPSFCAYN